jgi:hypothetical protein
VAQTVTVLRDANRLSPSNFHKFLFELKQKAVWAAAFALITTLSALLQEKKFSQRLRKIYGETFASSNGVKCKAAA